MKMEPDYGENGSLNVSSGRFPVWIEETGGSTD